jgi:hypothetical protein
MIGEEIPHALGEIRLIRALAMALPRQKERLEPFVRLDQGVHQTQHIGRVHVVVQIAVDQQQGASQVGGQLGIGRNLDLIARRRLGILVLARDALGGPLSLPLLSSVVCRRTLVAALLRLVAILPCGRRPWSPWLPA